ncbi:MAG TPA: hypothetical protein EYP56_23175 [Planctomycetaceae bacterium]|nr:hypothetical protein [Planctomycetaceae bacterium]
MALLPSPQPSWDPTPSRLGIDDPIGLRSMWGPSMLGSRPRDLRPVHRRGACMKQPAWLTALMLMALALGLFCLCGAAPGAASAPALVATEIDHQLLARARRMHERVLVLDTHVDIAGPQYATDQLDPGVDNPRLRCDLVKMAAGGVDGVFLAVYVGQGRRDAAGYRQALDRATGKFRAIHRLAERYPDRCALAWGRTVSISSAASLYFRCPVRSLSACVRSLVSSAILALLAAADEGAATASATRMRIVRLSVSERCLIASSQGVPCTRFME